MSSREAARRSRPAAPVAGQGPAKEQETKNKRPWPVQVIAWLVTGIVAALVSYYTVPSVHRIVAASACMAKYLTGPRVSRPPVAAWTAFGPSQLTEAVGALAVRPSPAMGAADEWFGVSLPVTASCDYVIRFQAVLSKPLYKVPGAGYGYGIGVRGDVTNGVPTATTIQYDPPFGGLRTVDVPSNANAPGYPPTPFPGMTPGRPHNWDIIVRGSTMLASLDGRAYPQLRLDVGAGNQLIVRIWNAKVTISQMSVTKLRPRF